MRNKKKERPASLPASITTYIVLCTSYFVHQKSSNRHAFLQINILNRVQNAHAFVHRALEGFAAANKAHTACTLVYYRRAYRFHQIRFAARGTAGVDKAVAAHVAVHHLVAAKI